ncbi:hypothetical protein E2562_031881 [Oryza meyeriana var. granulata]|uniref:Uncharacterized protein n=1 Tax=Oryza meyeriana var. granulata TaxID=110450 RepID=A0A6G1F0C6_9ORYZ|nr:hypothetical protein E2562_031881 [Oryza meyeriana var. granulata]
MSESARGLYSLQLQEVHHDLGFGCLHLRVFRLLHLLVNKRLGHVHHSKDSHLQWVDLNKAFVRWLVPMSLATNVDSQGTFQINARIVAKAHQRMLRDRHLYTRFTRFNGIKASPHHAVVVTLGA